MSSIVPIRINDAWVNLCGQIDSPRYVFIVDKIAKHAILNLASIGVDDKDAVVQITKGDFASLDSFVRSKIREYAEVKAVVMLWFGADELSEDAPPPGSLPPLVEEWLLPGGPRIMPKLTVAEVVAKYTASIRLCLDSFPNSLVISSDPPPRRSTGFATARANFVASSLIQQDARHRHVRFNRHFHGKKGHGDFNEGGKFPIHEPLFIDGVVPTLDSWEAIFRRTYAALTSMVDAGSVKDHERASLKLVKIVF